MIAKYLKSSIGRKQIVAVSGLFLMLFLIFHLSINLGIYLGPNTYNMLARRIEQFGPLLMVAELGLTLLFLIHIFFTFLVVKDARRARKIGYSVRSSSPQRSLSTRLMPLTGTVILVFIISHLLDFKFIDVNNTLMAVVEEHNLGIYGVVVNSFRNPFTSTWYMIAMIAIGSHLSHAIDSVIQTFGFNGGDTHRRMHSFSVIAGTLVALLFGSIPLYVLLTHGSLLQQ